MSEDWGPWIEHDQRGFPVPLGTVVHRRFECEVVFRRGSQIAPFSEYVGPLMSDEILSWTGGANIDDFVVVAVTHYRIRQGNPHVEALRDIAALTGEPVDA